MSGPSRPQARPRYPSDDKPRVRPTTDPPRSPVEVGDPAQGRKVPRCRICGLPEQPRNHLRVGTWTGLGPLNIIVAFKLPLCDRCVAHYSPMDPRAGDPLMVNEDAA